MITVFSIWKSLRVLQKAHIKVVARAVLHLPIFFLYLLSPVRLQNEKFLCRPSQIVCTVTAMNVMCTQAMLRVHKSPCAVLIPVDFYVKIIWICQFVRLFLPCAWMILSCVTSCEGHKLWKLSTLHWCYQPVTIENYFSRLHTDRYDFRK